MCALPGDGRVREGVCEGRVISVIVVPYVVCVTGGWSGLYVTHVHIGWAVCPRMIVHRSVWLGCCMVRVGAYPYAGGCTVVVMCVALRD